MIAQDPGGPDAELRAALGVDPVADGENGIEVEVLNFTRSFRTAGSMCIFCTIAFLVQLPSDERCYADAWRSRFAPVSNSSAICFWRQPDAFPLQPHIQFDGAVRGLIEDDLPAGFIVVCLVMPLPPLGGLSSMVRRPVSFVQRSLMCVTSRRAVPVPRLRPAVAPPPRARRACR